jgi:DMSO/TMAO reductase YedYZ molybdopterin-dependent catalytic subunit
MQDVTIDADMHCVTGWTTLDNRWEGVSFTALMERAKPTAAAKWVISQGSYGYTADLSLEAMSGERRPRRLAQPRRRPPRRSTAGPLRLGRAEAVRVEEHEDG